MSERTCTLLWVGFMFRILYILLDVWNCVLLQRQMYYCIIIYCTPWRLQYYLYPVCSIIVLYQYVYHYCRTHWGGSTRVLGWTFGRLLAEAPIWLADRLSDCWFNKLEARPAWYCNYTQYTHYKVLQLHKVSTHGQSTGVCGRLQWWMLVVMMSAMSADRSMINGS